MSLIEEKLKNQESLVDEFENLSEDELKKVFDEIFEKRTKGIFELVFNNQTDVKKLLNILSDKTPWTGNEAISLVTVYENIKNKSSKIESKILNEGKEDEKTVYPLLLEAHSIESCNYFLSKYSSHGYHSAREYLDVMIPVLRVISEFQKLETKLQAISAKKEALRDKKNMGNLSDEKQIE